MYPWAENGQFTRGYHKRRLFMVYSGTLGYMGNSYSPMGGGSGRWKGGHDLPGRGAGGEQYLVAGLLRVHPVHRGMKVVQNTPPAGGGRGGGNLYLFKEEDTVQGYRPSGRRDLP